MFRSHWRIFPHRRNFDVIFGLEAFISPGDAVQNIAYVKEGIRASASKIRNRFHHLCFAFIDVFCHIKGIFDFIFGLEDLISPGDAGQNIAYVKEGFRASASQIQRVFVGKILRPLSVGSMLHIAFLTECRQY